MTLERELHPVGQPPADAPVPGSPPRDLAALRRHSQDHAQAARDGIARVLSAGPAEQQLDQLKNQGGQ